MSYALPDQLSYDRMVPSDLGTNVEMCVVTPYTGSAPVTLSSGNYFIINIPKSGTDSVFDPMNSFLRFGVRNASTTLNCSLAGNVDCLFRRLEVYQGTNVLEQVDQYGNLSNILLNSQVPSNDRFNQWGITRGTAPVSTAAKFYGGNLAQSTTNYFTTTLLSGVVGSLSRCYIPLFALNGYLSFRLTLDGPLAALTGDGAGFTATNTDISLVDIEFHASIIHCRPEVISAISQPMYSIPSESYSCFECVWAKATQIEQLLPFKYVSLKTIFGTMRDPTVITDRTKFQNSYGCQDIYQYAFRCGSKLIPPNKVKCPATLNNIEAFEELKKAFHSGGNTISSMGVHTYGSWNKYTSTDTSGTFIIAQDLEKYTGKSGQIISGLDTISSDLFFSGTWADTTNAIANMLVDFYAHYDVVYVIEQGVMTAHF